MNEITTTNDHAINFFGILLVLPKRQRSGETPGIPSVPDQPRRSEKFKAGIER
jgi:hypothetical protein